MTHASNVLGTVQPIERIAPLVRFPGGLFFVDALQSAGVVPIDLRSIAVDLSAFPGHKALYGPTGTGALYVGLRAEGRIRPLREGGTGGDSSSETQPTLMPYLLEGGTPYALGVAGLSAGIGWVSEHGPGALAAHEVDMLQQVVDWAERLEGWRIAGRWDPSAHVGALSLIVPEGLSPQDLGSILDVSFDIAVRPGLHCVPTFTGGAAPSPRGRSASARAHSPRPTRSRGCSGPSPRSPSASSDRTPSGP